MKKIRTGDEVIIISGKDRGKQGTITSIDRNSKCLVTGMKIVKRHTKPNPQQGIQGWVVEKESLIDLSNVAIFNSSTKKADKVVLKKTDEGKKIRTFRSSGKEIK